MKKRGQKLIQNNRSRILTALKEKDPKAAQSLETVKLGWYRLKNNADDEEIADLYIYDEIVPQYMADWFGGVSAEGLIAELNEITASSINVRINSPGGAVFEAIAIYNALVSHSANINVYVDSLAASAASVIAMAGDKITMMVGSQMMIHDAMGLEMGNAAELRDFADFLDRQSDNIASIYAEKSGGDPKEMRDLMLAETWMFPEEAVELGLADEVYTRPKNQETEEDKPAEEDDESEETEESTEESETEEQVPDEDEEMQNLMNRRHRLVARGYKFPGRRKAPSPLENEVDDILAALGRK